MASSGEIIFGVQLCNMQTATLSYVKCCLKACIAVQSRNCMTNTLLRIRAQ